LFYYYIVYIIVYFLQCFNLLDNIFLKKLLFGTSLFFLTMRKQAKNIWVSQRHLFSGKLTEES